MTVRDGSLPGRSDEGTVNHQRTKGLSVATGTWSPRVWVPALGGFACGEFVRYAFAGWVCVDWQEPESPPQDKEPGQFEVRMPDEQVGTLGGHGSGDVAPTGADGDESAAADPQQQGTHVKHDGQAELEGGHLLTVHQDADGGPLLQFDLERGHADQFGAAGYGQSPLCGTDDVAVLAPPAHEHADQVDLQQGGHHGRRLLHGGLPGRLREM